MKVICCKGSHCAEAGREPMIPIGQKKNRSGKSELGSIAKLLGNFGLFTSVFPINIEIIFLLGARMGECNFMYIRGKKLNILNVRIFLTSL